MTRSRERRLTLLLVFMMLITLGCNTQKETPREAGKTATAQAALADKKAEGLNALSVETLAEVNGVKLTKAQFDLEMRRNLNSMSGRISPEQIEKLRPEIKKQIIDDFISRTLLSQEVKNLKIEATAPEITAATEQMKKNLPPGVTLEELLKKLEMSTDNFNERIILGVKIDKLVLAQPSCKANPTEKEVADYYKENKEKFKMPETVHARHILVSLTATDNDKTKLEKKAKAEMLRKQLLAGADFAGLAAKNSDCPSKNNGGDLGTFPRGQMVKPFDEAAFSQKANAIGPVVNTDFGYHIIQVLAHNEPKTINLDEKVKGEIGKFLKRQKMQNAYAELLKNLRAKATIILAGK